MRTIRHGSTTVITQSVAYATRPRIFLNRVWKSYETTATLRTYQSTHRELLGWAAPLSVVGITLPSGLTLTLSEELETRCTEEKHRKICRTQNSVSVEKFDLSSYRAQKFTVYKCLEEVLTQKTGERFFRCWELRSTFLRSETPSYKSSQQL